MSCQVSNVKNVEKSKIYSALFKQVENIFHFKALVVSVIIQLIIVAIYRIKKLMQLLI